MHTCSISTETAPQSPLTVKLPKELLCCLFMNLNMCLNTVSEHEMKLISASSCGLSIDETELKRDRKVRPFSMFEPTEAPATSLRKNQSSDDLVRDAQVRGNENTILTSAQEKNVV